MGFDSRIWWQTVGGVEIRFYNKFYLRLIIHIEHFRKRSLKHSRRHNHCVLFRFTYSIVKIEFIILIN